MATKNTLAQVDLPVTGHAVSSSALYMAAFKGHGEIVRALLAVGAQVDKVRVAACASLPCT